MPDHERDRFIVEWFEECWHIPDKLYPSRCLICPEQLWINGLNPNPDLSTPEGFFKVWEKLLGHEKWDEFFKWLQHKYTWREWENKIPSERADAVYEFLKEVKG